MKRRENPEPTIQTTPGAVNLSLGYRGVSLDYGGNSICHENVACGGLSPHAKLPAGIATSAGIESLRGAGAERHIAGHVVQPGGE